MVQFISNAPVSKSAVDNVIDYYEKVSDTTVTGSAVTDIDVTGLDLESDKVYRLVSFLYNPTGGVTNYQIEFNGDTTSTNYYYAGVAHTGSATSDFGANSNRWIGMDGGMSGTVQGMCMKYAGFRTHWRTMGSREITGASDIQSYDIAGCYNSTTNVTQITLHSSVASGIGVGSRFVIFKVSD